MDESIRRALVELNGGATLRSIQYETAEVWCGRACAAARLGLHDDAVEYAHEAIEHAALSGSDELLYAVRAAFGSYGVRV